MTPARFAWLAAALPALATPALAEPFKLKIACTATSDGASAMVARDKGLFAQHGLDADVTLIGVNTNIPPALVSDSIEIGGPTAPVFLQAVDGGLDLVVVAGACVMDPTQSGAVAAVLTAEPFVTRIKAAGDGEVVARFAAGLKRPDPIISSAATRSFVDAHPDVIKAFRAAIEEGAKIVNSDRETASQSIAKFTMPPLDIVRQQGMLQGKVDLEKPVAS